MEGPFYTSSPLPRSAVIVFRVAAMTRQARIAERAINVRGLPDGATVDVQDAFRSPKPATLATSCFSRAVFGKVFWWGGVGGC